jgi:hypothetical protein
VIGDRWRKWEAVREHRGRAKPQPQAAPCVIVRHPSPELRRRACGGWLALSPSSTSLQIGVTAETKEEAAEQFQRSYARTLEILGIARDENQCGDGI